MKSTARTAMKKSALMVRDESRTARSFATRAADAGGVALAAAWLGLGLELELGLGLGLGLGLEPWPLPPSHTRRHRTR